MTEQGFLLTDATLSQLAEDALLHARKQGATAAEVNVYEGFGLTVTARQRAVESIEYNRGKDLGISVYLGQRSGQASTSDFSRRAVEETVESALAIARFTAEDDCAGLPEEALLAREILSLDLYHPWRLSSEEAIALAIRSESAALDWDTRISNSEGASVSTQEAQFVAANSSGFMGGYPASRNSVSCSVIAGTGAAMQRDYWYESNRDAGRLIAPEAIGEIAAKRAVARLGAKKIQTGVFPVLFEATVAASLLGHFTQAVSGGALYRKASFLLDQMGKAIFPAFFNLRELPHLPGGLASAPFDREGVATHEREVVRDGVLQGYFLDVYSGRKLGLPTTANAGGCHNLLLLPGEQDLAGLMREMGRGLLVTELLGFGVNGVTGDYSRGAAGFWVEEGTIAHPVEEITIAGNLRTMFQAIVGIGNDVRISGSKQTGSILIEGMTVAT
ncbi:MAG: metalloprotease PmbA [Zoogloeaceae bacterium]|jgi:PmbA protein|nr:metalloprotease PmbA [Zoogloeaceae bacterium]